MSDLVLALDYGGTKLTAALFEEAASGRSERKWLALERVQKPAGATGDYDRATMLQLSRRLLGSRSPAAVGVSFGGPVDHPNGVVRLSHHVAGWEDVALAEQLRTEFGAPVRVDNDANAGALGEYRHGAGREVDSLLYVTVSTGVGGGWILGGRVWRGAEGMAGEFGHVTVEPDGPDCVCGDRGCVEAVACGPAMAAYAAVRLESDPNAGPELRRVAGAGPVTGVHLGVAAAAGDAVAIEALERGGRAIGTAIGSVANLVNPRRFVVGGGVIKSGDVFWQAVLSAADRHSMPEVTVDVRKAELGDDAPLWGAVELAREVLAERSLA